MVDWAGIGTLQCVENDGVNSCTGGDLIVKSNRFTVLQENDDITESHFRFFLEIANLAVITQPRVNGLYKLEHWTLVSLTFSINLDMVTNPKMLLIWFPINNINLYCKILIIFFFRGKHLYYMNAFG